MSHSIAIIEQKINRVIAEFGMLPEGCTVVTGLSGGADSMALTHFLHFRFGASVIAAHVNHGLRGEESDADEALVRRWCAGCGIPARFLRENVRELAAKRGQGLEECGRAVRYDFFAEISGGTCRVATAHTLSDLAETVLLRLASGAGARGLCGIPPVRGNIIRPLISLTRGEVEAYCAYYELPYCHDSSNGDRAYARNRVRLDIVPSLRALNPVFEQEIWKTARSLAEDAAYLESEGARALDASRLPGGAYRADFLRELPNPILARALMQAAASAGCGRMEYGHVQAAEKALRSGGALTLPGGIQFQVRGNTLFIGKIGKGVSPWQVPFVPPECVLPDGRTLFLRKRLKKELENDSNFQNLLFHNCMRYDTITNSMSLRSRRPCDVFRPAGRGVTKTLKKLFQEAEIPPDQRDAVVLLAAGNEIIWMEGFGPSEAARVTADTEWIAEIQLRGADDVK